MPITWHLYTSYRHQTTGPDRQNGNFVCKSRLLWLLACHETRFLWHKVVVIGWLVISMELSVNQELHQNHTHDRLCLRSTLYFSKTVPGSVHTPDNGEDRVVRLLSEVNPSTFFLRDISTSLDLLAFRFYSSFFVSQKWAIPACDWQMRVLVDLLPVASTLWYETHGLGIHYRFFPWNLSRGCQLCVLRHDKCVCS